LLMAMMIFELGRREFIDGDGLASEHVASAAAGASR
jgi:hypothetical protein